MSNSEFDKAVKKAMELAVAGETSSVKTTLSDWLNEAHGALVYARMMLVAGASRVDCQRAHECIANLGKQYPDALVIQGLYTLFGLSRDSDFEAALALLQAGNVAHAPGAFGLAAGMRRCFRDRESPPLEEWLAIVDRLGAHMPHFAMTVLSSINAGQLENKKIPQLAQRVSKPGFEFGHYCLWGARLGGETRKSYEAVKASRAHDGYWTIPYPNAWGIADISDNEIGFVMANTETVEGLGTWVSLNSVDALAEETAMHFSGLPCDPSSLRFAAWEDHETIRNRLGAMIEDGIGIRFDLQVLPDQITGTNTLSACMQFFYLERDTAFVKYSAKALESDCRAEDVRLNDPSIPVAKIKRQSALKMRRETISQLSDACEKHGHTQAVEALSKIDPKKNRQVDNSGPMILKMFSNDDNFISLPHDDWFTDDDPSDSYTGFIQTLVDLTGGDLPITNIRGKVSEDAKVEIVRLCYDGEELTFTGRQDWGSIHPDFLNEFLDVCGQGRTGRFVVDDSAEMLEIAYLPNDISTVLIERFYEFRG